jgi:hypothetical protein
MDFLAFLWDGADKSTHGSSPQQLWLTIAKNDWTVRTVTVCSVLISVAVTAQMGVFAAMFAAVFLKHTGLPTGQFPVMSMLRSINTGPLSLFTNLRVRHA